MKKPRHRIFDYTPRFYKPEDDTEEKRKKRLKFRYARKHKTKTRSPIIWLIFIAIVVYFYLKFGGYLE